MLFRSRRDFAQRSDFAEEGERGAWGEVAEEEGGHVTEERGGGGERDGPSSLDARGTGQRAFILLLSCARY